jgi:energy-coupling factor transporter ATP-binding protein EcfA2
MNFAAEHIRFSHTARHSPPSEVFRDLTLTVRSGECVGILGREGSGKTTLLNLLGGLMRPDGGSIRIDGTDPHSGPEGRNPVRLRMGFTFQFPEEQFLRQTVAEEFADVLRLRGIPAPDARARMNVALEKMGLDPGETGARSPFSLSLGESRRLALALLESIRPLAALCDEPTAGLDASGVSSAVSALRRLSGAGRTVIVATHDVDLLAEIAGRILILARGTIAADGSAGDILTDRDTLARHGYSVPEVVSAAAALREGGKLDQRRVLRLDELRACPGISLLGDSRNRGGGEHEDGDDDRGVTSR